MASEQELFHEDLAEFLQVAIRPNAWLMPTISIDHWAARLTASKFASDDDRGEVQSAAKLWHGKSAKARLADSKAIFDSAQAVRETFRDILEQFKRGGEEITLSLLAKLVYARRDMHKRSARTLLNVLKAPHIDKEESSEGRNYIWTADELRIKLEAIREHLKLARESVSEEA